MFNWLSWMWSIRSSLMHRVDKVEKENSKMEKHLLPKKKNNSLDHSDEVECVRTHSVSGL